METGLAAEEDFFIYIDVLRITNEANKLIKIDKGKDRNVLIWGVFIAFSLGAAVLKREIIYGHHANGNLSFSFRMRLYCH